MSSGLYFSLWLAAALVVIACISAALAQRARQRELHVLRTLQVMDALDVYAASMLAQRASALWDMRACDAALEAARNLARSWFPQLEAPFARLHAAHERLRESPASRSGAMGAQPQAWPPDSQDAAALLWHDHLEALAVLRARLMRPSDIENPQPGKGWG